MIAALQFFFADLEVRPALRALRGLAIAMAKPPRWSFFSANLQTGGGSLICLHTVIDPEVAVPERLARARYLIVQVITSAQQRRSI